MTDSLMDSQTRWDRFYMGMAQYMASKSKDPSTQVGAVITKDNRVVSTGYNGFARGVEDTEERLTNRELKYKLVIHAEENAAAFASEPLTGCTLYTWPFMTCTPCASRMSQHGIARHVAPHISVMPEDVQERWKDNLELAEQVHGESKIQVDFFYELDFFADWKNPATKYL